MRGLSSADVLELFERGYARSWVERGLAMLAWAAPDMDLTQRRAMAIGQRDRQLMRLRALTFGPSLAVRSSCLHCGLEVEGNLDLERVLQEAPNDLPPTIQTVVDGHAITLRFPTSEDLAQLQNLEDERASQQLAKRCILKVAGSRLPKLDAAVRAAAAEALSRADTQLCVDLNFRCKDCESVWTEAFDIVDFFWCELEAAAQRLVADVHTLAMAYGWTESDILALSPARRKLYLNMVSE
jgi:hypothetical protein